MTLISVIQCFQPVWLALTSVLRSLVPVGYELAKLLYGQGGSVYIAVRSSEKVEHAAKSIKASVSSSKGRRAPLILDLADFPTIKKAVNESL